MSKPLISVIIPVRNRTGLRLENALASLRWQTGYSILDVEIILSDFGSNKVHAKVILELKKKYHTKIIRTNTDELWNRAKALNIAIKTCTAPITFCTDADMIFDANFITTILSKFENCKKTPMVVCRCLDLPNLDKERLFKKTEFPNLKKKATMRKAMGTGACQATLTNWFISVRGYDEKYVFWGFEDKDMIHRANRSGLTLEWIHNETSLLHQWHRTTSGDKIFQKHINKIRYYLTKNIIKKNKNGWG